MKKWAFILLVAGLLAGCSQIKEQKAAVLQEVPISEDSLENGELCAFIKKIEPDTVLVDVAEYITDAETDRIDQLKLTEHDLINGYYIYNPDQELKTFPLSADTVYNFIDWDRDFVESDVFEDLKISTTSVADFITYINTYENSEPGMPFFFEIKDGTVVAITEKPMA